MLCGERILTDMLRNITCQNQSASASEAKPQEQDVTL